MITKPPFCLTRLLLKEDSVASPSSAESSAPAPPSPHMNIKYTSVQSRPWLPHLHIPPTLKEWAARGPLLWISHIYPSWCQLLKVSTWIENLHYLLWTRKWQFWRDYWWWKAVPKQQRSAQAKPNEILSWQKKTKTILPHTMLLRPKN